MTIVDSHCHLNFPNFEGKVTETIAVAQENGVEYMQTICTKISEYEEVYKIANENKKVFASVGIHPHEADKESVSLEKLIELTNRDKCIGIGETGLDYYYEYSDREAQKKNFITHIHAAQETDLPLIIHTRDAEEDTYEILKAEYSKKPFKMLLHCFTGTSEMAKKCMGLGSFISISGIVTFKKANQLQGTVKNDVPLERLLVETDSPYLAPVPYRGKTNQPAYTRNTAEFISELKGVTFEDVAKETTDNFFSLFTKAHK